MSRSKNYYQGYHLGRVQRSEYDDSKLRDIARHDAKLGESLKTVERAKNVMKKSLEADKQMFMKTGSQSGNKTLTSSHGVQARSCGKVISQYAKNGTDTRVKRYSVTDMPSDFDRSVSHREKSVPRPTSFHELSTDSTILDSHHLNKEAGSFRDTLLESSMTHQESVNGSLNTLTEMTVASGVFERLHEYDPRVTSETEGRSIYPANRSETDTSKSGKYLSKTETDKTEYRLRQKESNSNLASEMAWKIDDQSLDNNEGAKNKQDHQSTQHQHLGTRSSSKRSTIWDTLSTPKHTSNTKSKRSQIELEFTASHLKSSKSSPALFSTAKTKASAGQERSALSTLK